MAQNIPAVAPVEDAANLGPAMAKLSPQQRAWVIAFLETGHRENGAAAARAAGYGATSKTDEARATACQMAGSRLKRDPKVLAAIRELAQDRFRVVAHRATERVVGLLDSPDEKVALKAADMIFARTGLSATQQIEVNHNHRLGDMDDKAMIRRIAMLAQEQGMDPIKLLGSRGVVIDADFEVVDTGLTAPEEPAMSSEGLEDLL
jgi:phage terminase small subunit